MAERQKCDGDLVGEVRCSVLGRALGFPGVVTELSSWRVRKHQLLKEGLGGTFCWREGLVWWPADGKECGELQGSGVTQILLPCLVRLPLLALCPGNPRGTLFWKQPLSSVKPSSCFSW